MRLKTVLYLSPFGILFSLYQNIIAKINKPFMVYGFFSFKNKSYLKRVRISSSTHIVDTKRLYLHDNVWIWHHCVIDSSNGISIGGGTQIGCFVAIFTHSSHMAIRLNGKRYIEMDTKERIGYVTKPVEIGEYVFVGSSSLIYPGVKIGNGAIILPGSHVKSDVPPFTLVEGNPAKVITTVDNLDRMYLGSKIVQESYCDRDYLEKMNLKFKINQNGRKQ